MMIASAALSRLDAFGTEGPDDPTLTRVRAKYLERLEAATRTARGDDAPNTGVDPGLEATLHRMAIDEERAALVRMRDAGEISEEVFRTLERELDFEEARLQAS
jgi:CPA1 family monovalent cation:H+ antiporter